MNQQVTFLILVIISMVFPVTLNAVNSPPIKLDKKEQAITNKKKLTFKEKIALQWVEKSTKNPTDSTLEEVKVNGFAIASFVLGILSFVPFLFSGVLFSILAIIFSKIALKRIKRSGGLYIGENLAKTGFILGLVALIAWIVAGVVALIIYGS